MPETPASLNGSVPSKRRLSEPLVGGQDTTIKRAVIAVNDDDDFA
jgi:hypothetical protein